MHVHMPLDMPVHVHMHMSTQMPVQMSTHMPVLNSEHMSTHTPVNKHACMHAYTHVYTETGAYICTHAVHMCLCTCLHTCLYTCLYTYLHTCSQTCGSIVYCLGFAFFANSLFLPPSRNWDRWRYVCRHHRWLALLKVAETRLLLELGCSDTIGCLRSIHKPEVILIAWRICDSTMTYL